jgi:pyruvate dehydrogenase E2 component (dihydrolipoamide acetyltransferase)
MLAIVLAALLGVAPQGGTVYTTDGGRLRGTILDSGAGGVTVQLAEGSTRKLEASQVTRIDFADGTSWKPGAPPAAPVAVAPAASAAAAARPSPMQIPVEKLDTVHVARGGRVRCLVVEEGPDGVVVRLVDGAERRYAPGQVSRIDWADGTRSDLSAPPPAPAPASAPAPAPAPPAAAAPAALPAR